MAARSAIRLWQSAQSDPEAVMAHTFERKALYEEVWSTPLSTLGPRYGLSDNGMRKICQAMNIPLPPAGHWAKVAAGKPVRKIALPARAERTTFFSDPPLPTAREHVEAHIGILPSASCFSTPAIRYFQNQRRDPAGLTWR